jgi:hypothetical protein
MTPTLPPGKYPFVDEEFDLADMAFIEAPPDLDALFKAQRDAGGNGLVRDLPVILRCVSDSYEATFMVFWPRGSDRIHMLAPKKFSVGWA